MSGNYHIPKAGDTRRTIARRLERLTAQRDKEYDKKYKAKRTKKFVRLETRDKWAMFQHGKCLNCKNTMKKVFLKYSKDTGNVVGVVCEQMECRADKNFEFFRGDRPHEPNGR